MDNFFFYLIVVLDLSFRKIFFLKSTPQNLDLIQQKYDLKQRLRIVRMWYFKQTAKSLWQASKGMIVDNRSRVQILLDEIAQSEEQIISTAKLNQLAAATYEIQKFEQTLQTVLKRIKTFQYDIDEARKTLNILIATNYLIKHGATAFVDQLRGYVNVFQKYQNLKDIKTYEDEVLQKELSYELEKIRSRARHIQALLSDKQKLLKQKQLSMLIKQKMKLYEKGQTGDSKQNYNNDNRKERLEKQRTIIKGKNGNPSQNEKSKKKKIEDYADKLDGFLEKYLWKYVDKLDGKLETISEKVMENFDKYVLGELPENFEPDRIDDQEEDTSPSSDKKMTRQLPQNIEYQSLDDDDLIKRLDQQGQSIPNSNLIDFEQVEEEDVSVKKNQVQSQSLI